MGARRPGPAILNQWQLLDSARYANLLGAWFYMKSGLLAPISLRLADYADAHVIWPLLLL